MEIGTAEIIDNLEEPGRRGSGISTVSGSGKNGGGNNPGDGDGPDDDTPNEVAEFVPSKSRILTGFLLVVVLMTFGGLMAAYIVIATNNVAEWRPFELPIQVWLSTVIILISSLTYHFGKNAVINGDQTTARKWFLATTVLGAAFISSQILAWLALAGRGLYVRGNPYAGFFYILTAVHAVHVLGGIAALGSILLRVLRPTVNPVEIMRRNTLSQVVGWYWHLMGAVWLALFVLLGFWK